MEAEVIATQEGAVLATGWGLFGCFDTKGRLKHLKRLFAHHDDDDLKRNIPWNGAVLGVQPEPEGTLLISALHPGAVLRAEGHSNLPKAAHSDRMPPVQQLEEAHRTFLRSVTSVNPTVHWYRLDPVSGLLAEVAAPEGLHRRVSSVETYQQARWVFNTGARVVPRVPGSGDPTPRR